MEERFWDLFCATGDPVFYLLYRAEQEEKLKTAWAEAEAELL